MGFVLAKFSGLSFLNMVVKLVISEVMVFVQSWWGIVTNAYKIGVKSLVAKGIDLG